MVGRLVFYRPRDDGRNPACRTSHEKAAQPCLGSPTGWSQRPPGHHLPGIRTLDLEILGRVSLELSFDLWHEIGNPAHAAFLPYLPMRHRPRECSSSATQDGKNRLRLAGHGSQIREA
jgi:hypothetical protein